MTKRTAKSALVTDASRGIGGIDQQNGSGRQRQHRRSRARPPRSKRQPPQLSRFLPMPPLSAPAARRRACEW